MYKINNYMTKLNNTEHEEFICQAYLNRTHTTTQLQKEFKIYPTEIYKVLKKNNIELRGSNIPKEKALRICEEYKSGKSLKRVCEELGVAEATVCKIIKIYKDESKAHCWYDYSKNDKILKKAFKKYIKEIYLEYLNEKEKYKEYPIFINI